MPMSAKDFLDRLKLFNEKVDYILKSPFVKELGKSQFRMEWTEESRQLQTSFTGPDSYKRDAILLTIRMFCQDNDDLSICNIHTNYSAFTELLDIADKFSKTRKALNDNLDKNCPVSLERQNMTWQNITYRELFDVFLYGHAGHSNKKKIERYNQWKQHPVFPLLVCEYYHCLGIWIRALLLFKRANAEAITRLSPTESN